jgi:DinB superfamily
MDAICTAALAKFRQQEAEFRRVVTGLSDEALNWRPGPETNSLAVLVAHTWGAAQMHTARASGTEIARDRDAEFCVVLNEAECIALLDAAAPRVAGFVAAIKPGSYGDARFDTEGEELTVADCLIHALEHTQEHLGQAYLTRQLWEQRYWM